MSIALSCPRCGRAGQVPDGLLGRLVKCPDCRANFYAAEWLGNFARGPEAAGAPEDQPEALVPRE